MGRGAGGKGPGGRVVPALRRLPKVKDRGAVFKVLSDDEYERVLTQNLFPGDVDKSSATYISEERARTLAGIHARNPEIYPQGSPGPGIYIRESALHGTRQNWLSMGGTLPNSDYIPAHEYAHALDMERGFSALADWHAAIRHDGNWVLRNPVEALDPRIEFAEDFAAAVSGFLTSPTRFREYYPARAQFIEFHVIRE